jgi:MoaA/NifB/PqqE/SkfB family radical SAM enzyme
MRGPERGLNLPLWSELAYWRGLENYARAPRRLDFFARCTAGERHLMVGARGEVFFCPVNRSRTLGNLGRKPLSLMWSSPKAARERRFIASGRCHCWLGCVGAPATERLLSLALAK